MNKSIQILLASAAVLICAATGFAVSRSLGWDGGGGADANWSTAANWDTGDALPTYEDVCRVYLPTGPGSENTGPIITNSVAALQVRIGGDAGGLKPATLRIVAGGTLTVGDWMMVGPDSGTSGGRSGQMIMTGGTINVTNHFSVGFANAMTTGTLTMSGGNINVTGAFNIGYSAGAKGLVYLNGGTITAGSLFMNNSANRLDFAGGTLILNGDKTATVAGYRDAGVITPYGGSGTLTIDYGNINPGKTTVLATAAVGKASNPSPADNAANVSPSVVLNWTAGAGATSHRVYFGTTSPGTDQGTVSQASFDPGQLIPGTKYYWRVDEISGSNVMQGSVWTFTTAVIKASNPSPANNATQVSLNPTLSWSAGSGATSHDIYFGTTNPPQSIGSQVQTSFAPGTLTPDTVYYWHVDEQTASGTVAGDTWSFSTVSAIKKGPYLIFGGDNTSMTVLWQLPNSASCSVAWGLDNTYTGGSAISTEYGTDHQHKYTITNLTPGMKYFYKVTTDAGTYESSFITAPEQSAGKVKLLAYGDTRTYPADHGRVLGGMLSTIAQDPEYQSILLHVGDWSEFNTETAWQNQFFSRSSAAIPQLQAMVPIAGCMGNHEYEGTMFTKYYPYPFAGGRYWSFDYGPAHITVVDQYSDYLPGSAQYTWLVNDLSSTGKRWKIIVMHNPGYSAGGGHSNDTDVQQYIQPLCEQYGVQVVLCGHNHYYARAVVNGVHHVTTGAGGAPMYDPASNMPNIVIAKKVFEYCKLEIDDAQLQFQALSPEGTIVDAFGVSLEEPDFHFVQASDPQLFWGPLEAWQKTVKNINRVKPPFVIVTGDLVDNSKNDQQAQAYLGAASELDPAITLYSLPGNHDIGNPPNAAAYMWYQQNFGNTWYSFTYENCLFIALDSEILINSSGLPGKDVEEMNWLRTTLAAAQGYNHIFVFMHHALAANSIDESDNYAYNMPQPRRSELLSLFHQYNVSAVFAGHYHKNAYVRDGLLEIITTSSSGMPLSTDPVGFRVVKVYPRHFEQTYHALSEFVELPADLNGDDVVDFNDFVILAGNWLGSGLWP